MLKVKSFVFSLLFTICVAFVAGPVLAQGSYTLNVHRNVGYSSGDQIRGSFNLAVVGPANIQSVTFLIDGQSMKQVTAAPFSLDFNTTDYPLGFHDLSATVRTTDGQSFITPVQRFEFATADEELASVRSILIPILGVVVLVVLIVVGSQVLFSRNKPRTDVPLGAPRQYGLAGRGGLPEVPPSIPIVLHGFQRWPGQQVRRAAFSAESGAWSGAWAWMSCAWPKRPSWQMRSPNSRWLRRAKRKSYKTCWTNHATPKNSH